MSKNTFKIIYTGYLDPHTDKDDFIQKFADKFRITRAKALALTESKKEVLLKKDLSIERAQKYHSLLKSMGMIVRMEATVQKVVEADQSTTQIIAPPYDKTEVTPQFCADTCPQCGSSDLSEMACSSCGFIFDDNDDLGETQVIPPLIKDTFQATDEKPNKKGFKWMMVSMVLIILTGLIVLFVF